MDFTGSDWCGWCIKFKKEVLDTAEFQQYAAKNVVLVELDYPNKKVQSAELKKANAGLKDQYDIHGYPTLVVLNKDGKEIGRQVGYSRGRPEGVHRQAGKIQGQGLSLDDLAAGRGLTRTAPVLLKLEPPPSRL